MADRIRSWTAWTEDECRLAESVALEILEKDPKASSLSIYRAFLARLPHERMTEKMRCARIYPPPSLTARFNVAREILAPPPETPAPEDGKHEETLSSSPPPYGETGSSPPVVCRWEWTEEEKDLVYEQAVAYVKEHRVTRKRELVEHAQALLPLHRRKPADALDEAAEKVFQAAMYEARFLGGKEKVMDVAADENEGGEETPSVPQDELGEAVAAAVHRLVEEVRRTVAQQVEAAKSDIIAAVVAALDARSAKDEAPSQAPSVREAVKAYLPAAPVAKAKPGPRICVVSHQAHGLKFAKVPEGVTVEWKDTDKPNVGSVRGFDFVVFMPGYRRHQVEAIRSQIGREKVITLSVGGMSSLEAEITRLTAKWRYNQSHGVRPEKEKT